ncbi:MAG: DctP family transporter solute-binding subunit [Firmicutes bacterium]|jgi:tripartite ATP-independent transporter DctP family solute receptor|nr:DctP family transporter solute-binding subunit [Bacillota bacterium]
MKKTWILVLVGIMVIAFGSSWWLSGDKNSFQQTKDKTDFVLRLGHGSPISSMRHELIQQYADWVYEQTNGRAKIEVFPNEILGSEKQMTQLVVDGTLDITIVLHGLAADYAPKLAAVELPFLFSSMDKVGALLDGPLGDELAKDMPAKGLRLLSYWDNGLRQISNNKLPIEKPEDLKGLKIRTPESKMTLSIFKTLGATPAPLAFNEVYLALADSRFDGQENPVVNIHMMKFNEVQKYLSITNHKYESNPMLMNEQAWQKLPPDIQKVLKEGAVKFAVESRRINQEAEGKALSELEAKGMKISRPDIGLFRESTKSVYDEWSAALGKELIDKVISAAK